MAKDNEVLQGQTQAVLLTEDDRVHIVDALRLKLKSVERAKASEVNKSVAALRQHQADELLRIIGLMR